MNNNYVSVKELFNDLKLNDSNTKIKIKKQKLYQLEGEINKNSAIIKYIGNSENRPTVVILDFNFKGYICKIISYILNDYDIEYSNKSNNIKMIGLVVEKHKKVILSITLLFITNEHKNNNKKLINYISEKNKECKIHGYYKFELKYNKNNNIIIDDIGKKMDNYIGKNKSIYKLIDFLSNDKIIEILNY
jgi:hypothetical protein